MTYEVATRIVAVYGTQVEADSAEAARQIVAGPDYQWPNLADREVKSAGIWTWATRLG